MPFGLCNAPATLMRHMSDLLHPFIDSFVILYLDDMLIFSNTWKENLLHAIQVLETLKKTQLIANLHKSDCGKTSLIYIGHVIEGGELRVDPKNISAITQWPILINVTKVRSFMGET